MKASILSALLLTCLSLSIAADEVLDNQAIVRMLRAGLGSDVIVLKIERSAARFDVDTDALIALKSAGASDSVIKAVLLKADAKTAVVTAPVPPVSTATTAPAPVVVATAVAPASTAPNVPSPGSSSSTRCATVQYYTLGNNGWGWNPAGICVAPEAFSIDEQDIPIDEVKAYCKVTAALLEIGGSSMRGEQEWWVTDGKDVYKLRARESAIDPIIETLAALRPSLKHGSCGSSEVRALIPKR